MSKKSRYWFIFTKYSSCLFHLPFLFLYVTSLALLGLLFPFHLANIHVDSPALSVNWTSDINVQLHCKILPLPTSIPLLTSEGENTGNGASFSLIAPVLTSLYWFYCCSDVSVWSFDNLTNSRPPNHGTRKVRLFISMNTSEVHIRSAKWHPCLW